MAILNRMLMYVSRMLMYVSGAAMLATASPALAGEGQPSPWQMTFQNAATPIMEQITSFHRFVNIIIVCIALFVLGLLIYVMVRFNEKRNPQPSRTTHNTVLEIAWTVIPVLILVSIAIPSFRLLFAQYDFPIADLTVTATGSQWYWTYDYPDHGITFASIIVQDADLKPGQPRLLTVDHELVVPVNKNVIVQVKAVDVIHDWAVPSFGIKLDAVPGRLQRTWFRAERTGMFYGECSELCGRNHAFMPIAVHVVTDEEFADWLAKHKPSASLDDASRVATAEK
jgi:cytochrome c oxidase subunit II